MLLHALLIMAIEKDNRESRALVIDSTAASRSILVAQLREYGVARIEQCSRVQDARARLEHTVFDYVLCEQHFPSGQTGQSLLDDLRRAQLLPFSTVFFMVTTEASYAAVAEAAESALDGYLLKPFTPSAILERLSLARTRKNHLRPIFDAIGREAFEEAAALCMQRFEARQPYWLYAARIGSELLLRLGRYDEGRMLFEAVIAARALPWAKLGVARSLIGAGQTTRALSTLQALIGEDPSFADAYDVLGCAQVEMGLFADAVSTYRTASTLAPDSIVRCQKMGMMAYYMGDRETAIRALSRAVMHGIDSKLLDYQSIVLLAFSYLADNDRKGLGRCMADFARILGHHGHSRRLQRFQEVVHCLQWIQQRQFAQAVSAVQTMASEIDSRKFDFEAACNLAALLSALSSTTIKLGEAYGWIQAIGARYANTRGSCELLANACQASPDYADAIRNCLAQTNKAAENAVAQSLAGDPEAAVVALLERVDVTLNTKLLDMAQQLLIRNGPKIRDPALRQAAIDALRSRCGVITPRAIMGRENEPSVSPAGDAQDPLVSLQLRPSHSAVG